MTSPAASLTILTGASRGLGRALAERLLQPGHRLICMSRSTDEVLRALADTAGAPLEQWTQDLADADGAAQQLRIWLDRQSPDVWTDATLINNAGTIPPVVPLREARADDTRFALRVGLEAPLLLTSAFLGATRAWQSRRKVLNISSGLGRRPMASQSAYCTAKAGMDMFTRCAALDEAQQPNGARLCSLAPGAIDTDMQVQLRSADAAGFPDRSRFEALHAGGQLTSPADAADRVLAYLARADFGAEPVADVRG
ncbi:SDR family NAD(P)-dependent oxidoreductase [uncultured Xylophilus sp.]|uniref:SDR family NAD(P)-dependent oxidoreductase n=1 Tax=uncultured Xylophilus sp. TaxID=296832 RepID=UPI0025E0A879|nr:SDR family NAD(P)-dependent oxidoreductase [uncultured Xylophilus sp.]